MSHIHGNIPAPNPDYPQQVKVVTGNNNVVISNKNLFDKDNANIINGFIDTTTHKIVANNANRICYISCSPNTTYTISSIVTSQHQVGTTQVIPTANVDVADFTQSFTSLNNRLYATITTSANAKYIVYRYVNTSQGVESDIRNSIQIEKNSNMTSYIAHQGATYPLSLGSIELCKIGTYQDYIAGSYNNWKIKRKVRHLSLAIADMNNGENYPGWKNQNQVITDLNVTAQVYITGKSNIRETDICLINTNADLFLPRNKYGEQYTDSYWKANYPNLIFDLYYGITNEQAQTEETITDTTLIGQLNDIYYARSYKGQTNITSTYASGNEQMIINATVLTTGLERTSNKVTAISAYSTDEQYPSAKCVYGIVGDINSLLDNLNGEVI